MWQSRVDTTASPSPVPRARATTLRGGPATEARLRAAAALQPVAWDAALAVGASGRRTTADRQRYPPRMTVYGCDVCQDVCPFNVKFAQELREPAFAAREALGTRAARTLAREVLGMAQEELRAAFKRSPMKRAKLRGLKRNAAVVLGNVGTGHDPDVLTRALDDEEPLVREHAAWAIRLLTGDPDAPTRPLSEAGGSGPPRAVQPETLIPRRGSGAGVP